MTNSDVRADGARWAKDWLSGNPCEAQFLSGVGKWAVEFAIAAYVAGQANPSPPAMDREAMALAEAQDKRRAALVERIGTIADLTANKPLKGELGDIAYDLLRQAAAQIASDRQRIALAGTGGGVPEGGKANNDDCPCCGSHKTKSIKGDDKIHPYHIVCESCGIRTANHGDYRACARSWRRRPTPTSPDESRTAEGEAICGDCPPVGYPTDKARCTPCPRSRTHRGGEK